MTHAFHFPAAALLIALASSSLIVVVPAQIPDGHFVVSACRGPSTGFPGLGGIYFAHPRTPQAMTELANVPPDLTRASYSGTDLAGASCVLLHPSGDLLVGERGLNGDAIELHRLALNGTTVVCPGSTAMFTP